MIQRALSKLKAKTTSRIPKKVLKVKPTKVKVSVLRAETPVEGDVVVELKDLDSTDQVLIRPSVTVIKPFVYGKPNYSYTALSVTLPKEFVVKGCTKQYDDMYYLEYYNVDTTMSSAGVYLPADLKLTVVADNAKAMKLFTDYKVKNISQNLRYIFSIGSDPEMFVVNKNNEVIPAFDFLGSKSKPNFTAPGAYGNTKMYWDGFQAEFETHPITCLAYHCDSVYCGIKGLSDAAKKHNPEAKLSLRTTMNIGYDLLSTSKEEHVQFGCMPSLNVYGMSGANANGREVPFRSAGGHIHFGCGKLTEKQIRDSVKALDAILGVACVSLFARYDDPRRRTLYGLAGEYRLPPHGLEYRVLSNAWMSHPAIMNLVFDTSRKAFMFGKNGFLSYWDCSEAEVIRIINSCDVTSAREVLKRNKDLFIQILMSVCDNVTYAEQGYRAYVEGMECVINNPEDIEGNWLVNGGWCTHLGAKNTSWIAASTEIKKGNKVGA